MLTSNYNLERITILTLVCGSSRGDWRTPENTPWEVSIARLRVTTSRVFNCMSWSKPAAVAQKTCLRDSDVTIWEYSHVLDIGNWRRVRARNRIWIKRRITLKVQVDSDTSSDGVAKAGALRAVVWVQVGITHVRRSRGRCIQGGEIESVALRNWCSQSLGGEV